jgi:hypothetical protein
MLAMGMSADEVAKAQAQARSNFAANKGDDAVKGLAKSVKEKVLADGGSQAQAKGAANFVQAAASPAEMEEALGPKATAKAVTAHAQKGGLSASEAKATAKVVENEIIKGVPGAKPAAGPGLNMVGKVMAGANVVGGVASIVSGAEQSMAAHKSFKEGDKKGGAINTVAAAASFAGGAAGIGAVAGTVMGVAALSGPLLPIVAVGAGLVSVGMSIWNFFHQKGRSEQTVNEQKLPASAASPAPKKTKEEHWDSFMMS